MSEASADFLDEVVARLERLVGTPAGDAARSDAAGRIRRALDALESAAGEPALANGARLSTSILACAPQAIITVDASGRIIVFSPGAEAMLG